MGKNGFPRHFVDNCIKAFLDKMFETKRIVTTVSKRELRICLPFLGKESLKIKSNLSNLSWKLFLFQRQNTAKLSFLCYL